MSKEFIIFDNEEMSLKMKFYRLMDLVVTNKSSTRMEVLILFGIFYIQMLSGFFDTQLGVLEVINSNSDNYLNILYKIVRVKGILMDNFSSFSVAIYIPLGALILITILFFSLLIKMNKHTFYSYKEFLLNFCFKVFLYIAFNPILDLTLTNFCFEDNNTGVSCSITNFPLFVIGLILLIYSIFISFFLNLFYNDSYFLSSSFYSRMNCGYEIYLTINSVIYSVLLNEAMFLGKEIFLIYNFVISLVFLKFYFGKYLFYDGVTNGIVGIFHILYVWTSLFFLIFAYITLNEKGIIYLIGCAIFVFLFFNLRHRFEEHIILNTPYHKISNKYHLMFYLKSIIDKIHNLESNIEAKAELVGIIQTHIIECPSPLCLTKHKDKRIYLPVTDEWSDRDKPEVNDKVFLLNFIIFMANYFISQSYYSPEMLINLSLYYLNIIGNYCQAIFYYKKVKEMKLSHQETFSFVRLNFTIRKALLEKLRPSSEASTNLEDVNSTLYFKYEDLSLKFFEEINNDINLSLEFWKSFKTHNETGRPLDFTKIFNLTDKIRVTKNKIEKIWGDLYGTFSGVNDLFELYENYVEQINDDDMLKRELETIKSKNATSAEHIQTNFYNVLFNKETGIIIANGDKSKEGIIEKTNEEVEKIFDFKADELKGMNVSYLMPKLFEKLHRSFMQRYYDIGEKRRIDRDLRSFGKDRDNNLVPLKLYIKLFPMLNDSVYYCSMVIRENFDDVILIDSKYNIQGISKKLMNKFNLDNKNIFADFDIPFYIICRKFINFYRIFLQNKNKKGKKDLKNKNRNNTNFIFSSGTPNSEGQEEYTTQTDVIAEEAGDSYENQTKKSIFKFKTDNNFNNSNENITINENIELEFEIAIPEFLYEYVSYTSRSDKKSDLKMVKTNNLDSSRNELLETDTIIDFEENDNLVNEVPKATTSTPTYNLNNKNNFNKQSDEDKEFNSRIKQHRNLFETGKLNELEDMIDKLKEKSNMKEFKFNFTFDKYKFGEGNCAYIVRCIDNKTDMDYSQSNNSIGDNELDKLKMYRHQKQKIESLKELNEITAAEKQELAQKLNDYLRLSLDDKEFSKTVSSFKDEIANTSKVFGYKKEDATLDDENSSQSSQSSFNDNIAKKSRIEEIRSNIMLNVSNFYSIKWIKAIFYIVIIMTAAFCGFYLMIFDIIFQDLNNISSLNIGLFKSTISVCNIISTLISLRSTYHYSLYNQVINYNSYINSTIYFDTLRGFTNNWYNDVMTNFGSIEQQINFYFKSQKNDTYWSQKQISYPDLKITFTDNESFEGTLAQAMSGTNQLIKNNFFSNNKDVFNSTLFTTHSKDFVEYSAFMAIENAIDNLLPRHFDILNSAPTVFTDENNGNIRFVIIIILSYAFAILVMIFLYSILLYLTNKNMEEGLEKVSKIKLERIDETIKKIEIFNDKCLSKYRQKDSKSHTDETKDLKTDSNYNSTSQIKEAYQKIFSEGQKYKSLRVLSYSYLQIIVIILICCAILIPIYFVSLGMIDSSNQMLAVQNYIFGKSLTASASTVNIKCIISECNTKKPFNYQIDFVDRSSIESIVRNIGNFPELSDFYSNKFLLNACAAIYPQGNNTNYTNCMNDLVIKSANNTDSLLKLIDETVATILKDKEMKTNTDVSLKDNSTAIFTNPLLFETKNFRDLEYIFYNYITPISDNFSNVVTLSLNNYLLSEKLKIIILISVFAVLIVLFSFYIAFIFTKKLIHLLSVARVILRIIPTSVINNTQDLETWIENKY